MSKQFTTNDAARRFRRTTARIRQICIDHDIGEVVHNRIRLLTADDLERIRQHIRPKRKRRQKA